MEQLAYDLPTSLGMANVLKRAKAFTEIRWLAIERMPRSMGYKITDAKIVPSFGFRPWRARYGLPYSSVRYEEKFFGFNISLETFITALANPKSVLYTHDLTGLGTNMSTWYGTVCSAFVAYALDLPYRRHSEMWNDFGDMAQADVRSAQDIQLCDVLSTNFHIALITNVARNEDGSVARITVTEATTPQIIAVDYTPLEFEKRWLCNFMVFRYRYIDRVSYTPSPYIQLPGDPELPEPVPNEVLLPNFGDKANYRLDESVELNIMQDDWKRLIIEHENGSVAYDSEIAGTGVISWKPAAPDFYRAYCKKDDTASEAVEFCVTDFTTHLTPTSDGAELTFSLKECDRLVSVVVNRRSDHFTVAMPLFTPEESARREKVLSGIEPGIYDVRAIAKNRFGMYIAPYAPLEIPEAN